MFVRFCRHRVKIRVATASRGSLGILTGDPWRGEVVSGEGSLEGAKVGPWAGGTICSHDPMASVSLVFRHELLHEVNQLSGLLNIHGVEHRCSDATD